LNETCKLKDARQNIATLQIVNILAKKFWSATKKGNEKPSI